VKLAATQELAPSLPLKKLPSGANPTTSEFITTTPANSKLKRLLKMEENIFVFVTRYIGYSWLEWLNSSNSAIQPI
jgi:hypothetical protein